MSEFLDAVTGGLQAALGYQAIFFVLLAVGLNVHFGYTGLLNFGQAAFALLVLIVVLLVRPQGILGRAERIG